MKALYILSLAVLGLIPTISGTAEMLDGAASSASHQSGNFQPEALAMLKAQAAASDATLLRPL